MDYQIAASLLALSVLLLQTTANDEQNGKAYSTTTLLFALKVWRI